MNIAVKKEPFKKVVSCTTRATASKAIQPILNNLLLSCSDGSLTVSATDLDLAIECRLPADVTEPGKVTLPAKKLDEIVNKAPGDEVSISIDKNLLTKILSDRSRYQINGVSSEDFPEVTQKEEKQEQYSINQEELLRAISLTSFATSRFESTSILSGANFEVIGNRFEIGATDGSRLARYKGELDDKAKDKRARQSAVIPGRALAELERLITCFKDESQKVNFYFSVGQIVFKSSDFTLSTRLLSGTFPAYDKLIPEKMPHKATFKREDLLGALERVAVLANERTNVIKLTFKKGADTVKLTANSPDYGNAADEIDADYNGDDLEIAFNYKYLSEALRSLQAEKVFLELEASLSPIILKIDEKVSYDYTYLVMPVQLR